MVGAKLAKIASDCFHSLCTILQSNSRSFNEHLCGCFYSICVSKRMDPEVNTNNKIHEGKINSCHMSKIDMGIVNNIKYTTIIIL